MKIQLCNSDDGMITVYCYDQQDAIDDQSINGANWEAPGDMNCAYASFPNEPGLVEKLESEGYDVDDSEYTPFPEGEHTYTTAPEEYDGFGTELIAEIGRMKKGGTTVRLVATPAEHLDWQRNRYYSGGIYFVGDFDAWKKLLDAGIAEH